MKDYLKDITRLLGKDINQIHKLLYLFAAASIIDLIGLGLISPYIALVSGEDYLINFFVQYGITVSSNKSIIIASFILLLVFAIRSIFAMRINWKIIDFSLNQQLNLRSYLMKSYQLMPYIEHTHKNSASNIYNIQQLTNQYSMQVLIPTLKALGEGLVIFFIFIFLAWTNFFALSLMLFLLVIALVGYDKIFRSKIKEFGVKANTGTVAMIKSIQESSDGLKEIRVLGKERHLYNIFKSGANENAFYVKRVQFFSTMPRYMFELIIIIFVVFVTLSFVLSNQKPDELTSLLAIFGVASLRLIPAANLFSMGLTQLRYNRDAISRLVNDLDELSNIEENFPPEVNKNYSSEFRNITLKNVTFSYKGLDFSSINDSSIEILSGEVIGIIGASGSGKTTLIDLMLGLLQPQSGKILYNGRNLTDVIDEWRSQIAYLPQKTFLIDDSLINNITFGTPKDDVDIDLLWRSVKKAQLTDFIDQLPEGIDTLVGESGERLSGGQRQRIALARAFYFNRRVLIMDESTSALDFDTEQEIINEIKELKDKLTIIIVSHRIETMKFCDRIYRIEDGNVKKV
jgi:ATP-binding cassette, subfamily B, bacterial PglK